MKFTKSPQTVNYMLRHYLTVNITDPLSLESRGYTEYTQYFYTDNTTNQILYLERKIVSNGKFELYIDNVLKTLNVDYTLDTTYLKVTIISAYNNKEVKVIYDAVRSWVYDDHPNLNAGDFPRITLEALPVTYETTQIGEYYNYTSSHGNLVRANFKIIIRNRDNNNFYTYNSDKLKRFDLINAISDKVILFFKTNKQNSLWKFRTFNITNVTRITTEEDSGILRNDMDLEVLYFHNES